MTGNETNILVELLKQGSFPVAVIFMMFLFIRVLWKKQEEFYNRMTSLIEASIKNTNCIEKNNEILTEILYKVNDLYVNNNIEIKPKPMRKHKAMAATK